MTNWIKQQNKVQEASYPDKIKQLLKISSKLVLVQRDELLNIKEIKRLKDNHITYINYLYNHYITSGLGKSYNY
jgi:hypothetical protein